MIYVPSQEPQVPCQRKGRVEIREGSSSLHDGLGAHVSLTEDDWFPHLSRGLDGDLVPTALSGFASSLPPPFAWEPTSLCSVVLGTRVSQTWDAVQS